MDTKFQTSFIPKKTITPGFNHTRSEPVSLFLLISIIVFILSLATAGGVFGYKKVLIGRIDEMNRQLAEAKNSFEPDFISELNRFNKRIESAKSILASHSVVLPVFDLLENSTLATVKFNSFSYDYKDGGSGAISMSGEAKNFSSVALQSDIFGKEKFIKNPVFSDLNPDQSGNIVFKFNATVDPLLTSYEKNMKSSQTELN